jgi:hypothetical protein
LAVATERTSSAWTYEVDCLERLASLLEVAVKDTTTTSKTAASAKTITNAAPSSAEEVVFLRFAPTRLGAFEPKVRRDDFIRWEKQTGPVQVHKLTSNLLQRNTMMQPLPR